MKRSLRAVVGVAAITALLGGLAVQGAGADGATDLWPTFGSTHVLNPSGGITGTDGMRITFGGSQLAVQRVVNPDYPYGPNNETYSPQQDPGTGQSHFVLNQIALAVGDSASGGTAFIAPSFMGTASDPSEMNHADDVTIAPWTVASSASGDQIVSVLTGVADGLTYTVAVTINYTAPDDRMKISYQVVVPAGNTKPVRLYHLIDTYLGGSDSGPGFFTDPVDCGSGAESGAIVGVDRADKDIVEAFQFVSGTPWAGYMSAAYSDVVFGTGYKTNVTTNDEGGEAVLTRGPKFGPGHMNDLNNQIITDPSNDNGIGINWNFGTTPGTYESVAKLIFTSTAVDPCSDADAVSVTNPDPTEVPDPIIDPVAPDAIIDELKDPELTPEVTVPSFTG